MAFTPTMEEAKSQSLPIDDKGQANLGLWDSTNSRFLHPRVTASGGLQTGVESAGYEVATTITRPANQTPYTAKDVVGGALDLGVLGPSAGTVIIQSARLELDVTSIPSGMTSFELWFYSVTPPSAVADNGAWDLVSGDRASFLGKIDLGTPVDQGSTLVVEQSAIAKMVKLAGTHLFGYLVTAGGFTPAANSEVYKVTVSTVAI